MFGRSNCSCNMKTEVKECIRVLRWNRYSADNEMTMRNNFFGKMIVSEFLIGLCEISGRAVEIVTYLLHAN